MNAQHRGGGGFLAGAAQTALGVTGGVLQPGAPYYMAQTIVIQEQALAAAEARLSELNYLPFSAAW